MQPKRVVRKVVKGVPAKGAPIKGAPITKSAKLRPDAATNKPGGVKAKVVELAETLEVTPLRDQSNKVKLNGGYRQMPFDMPMYIQVTRLVNEADGAVEGYVVSLDAFTYGREVHVRIGKPKGWRKGHSPETTAKDSDKLKVWVNKNKIYEGAHGDADDRYKNGDK